MSDMSKAESMRAAREARDRAGTSRGSSAESVEAAMRRYLSAEQYHDLVEGAPRAEKDEKDEKDESGE